VGDRLSMRLWLQLLALQVLLVLILVSYLLNKPIRHLINSLIDLFPLVHIPTVYMNPRNFTWLLALRLYHLLLTFKIAIFHCIVLSLNAFRITRPIIDCIMCNMTLTVAYWSPFVLCCISHRAHRAWKLHLFIIWAWLLLSVN